MDLNISFEAFAFYVTAGATAGVIAHVLGRFLWGLMVEPDSEG